MGKNIKSYATTQVHFPREREGSLTAKGPNISFTIWYGLTVHIICFKITSKIFKIVFPSQIPANYANSAQFAPTVRKFRKIRTIRLTCYTLCFSHLSRQRTLRNSSELRKFRTIRLHSPQIMQNSHILLTYSILCFRHLPWQKTFRNSSGSCKFRAVRPHSPRIT